MKKALKWMGIAVLTPILLFVILAVLIYLPPVQNWAVRKVAAVASEKTGMQISVEHVNLEFPLDLGIEGFRALHPNDSIPGLIDTIADVRKMVCDVQLLPLLQKRVVIDELSLAQAKINTNGFISDLRVKGQLQELWLSSRGIDLDKETVEVNGARLSEAHLDIALSDTAAVDTTESTAKWIVNADSVSVLKSQFLVHLPGDTLNAYAYMGKAVARDVLADLGQKQYRVGQLVWQQGRLNYDNRYEPAISGLDYNHLALTDINLQVDSFEYVEPSTAFVLKDLKAHEKSGLQISHLMARVAMDDKRLTIPQLRLRTPDTEIDTELAMDLNTFDQQHPGAMKMRLNAQIGKQDVMRFVGGLPHQFVRSYPNYPISIKGSINGNMQHIAFTGLNMHLPTAFHLKVSGTADHVTDIASMKADICLNARAENMNFMLALADPSLMRHYRIPAGMTLDGKLKANATHYSTQMVLREGAGSVNLNASASIPVNARGDLLTALMKYEADMSVNSLNLHHFMPRDSIYTFSSDVKANGYGTNFLSPKSRLKATAKVRQLQYGSWNLKNINAEATLANGHALAKIIGHNELLQGTIGVDAQLNTKKIMATLSADLDKADLYRLRLVDTPLAIGLCGSVDVASDMKLTHRVTGLVDEIYISGRRETLRPDFIGLHINTTVDTVMARVQSGDFIVKVDASGNYERLLKKLSLVADSAMAQIDKRIIDQPALKRLLPEMKLHVESKRNNPLASLMKALDVQFKELMLDVSTSPVTGVNGQSYLYSLVYDSTRIDTIRLNLTQKGERLTYQGQVRNNKRNPQFVFNALIDGTIHQHGALAGLRYYDQHDKLGVRLGATADMEPDGIRFKLLPDRPTIGYKEFNLNKDNYLFLARNKRLQAKVDLIADDKTGIKLYTENQDSTMLQDITLSINQLDLGEITAVVPYLPRITGKLNGDYHILQDKHENISVASDMGVRQMTFEGSPVGNISAELVYLMKENDTHAVEARLMLDDEEFGMLSGIYQSDGFVDAKFDMTRLPLSLVNGFVPDQLIGLEGYGEGSVTIRGTADHPEVNGEVFVDSAYLVSIPYGIRMRFDNDPVRIVGSKLLLENFGLYSSHNDLLNLMGSIDFSDTDHILMDMRMRARDFLLIDAKQQARSVAWGKAYVNFMARMQGPLDELNMRGRLDVLGSTDLTYMLLDSPLSTDTRLDELVKFTDFSYPTASVVTKPTPSGLNIDLNVSVSQGAHIVCDLNADESNYVDLMGGGDMRLKYNSEGINLTGRYTLNSGQMKYSLPVIPLKTFAVKEGSYVEFTGDPMNPKLNITATERVKSNVTTDVGASRSVQFDCGVIITKTLNDMGLEFIIEAPEDQSISGELATMSKEERGKLAVGMLTTGMYLADGNTGAFSMNSALSSFLQSEINNIAGSALKTLDLSVGIDNTTDASGMMHTDYSFKFAKRFFNNRLKIELGGKVSSGANDAMGQNQSFFDNVTMEYRLNQDATKNIKLFYNQNVYDWLEGYTGEYGIGFVWRRKMNSLLDLFTKTPKLTNPLMPLSPVRNTPGADSTRITPAVTHEKK
ncbi:translocation/assembly module TamB domain-containing protein [Prevotella sp. MA2016]|uniref:translocation/assembly module TamB domain-containing protein n=1 Tax=Prevotella sp. MA2016 TaxID=1408310 RepID=UPI00068805F0|nr:translocation/assembly module TamB domain-containing protein [Prevotella sp. MA2016]